MRQDPEIRLVIVGHFGIAEDRTPFGNSLGNGGSGYACAVGAGAGDPRRVGVVARIGEDFDYDAIVRLGVDTRGAVRVNGGSPRFRITQHSPTQRSFESTLGVAATPAIDVLPPAYRAARHVHIGTVPIAEQRHWLQMVRDGMPRCAVSVDMFEATAKESPAECRELAGAADLVFMNEAERHILYDDHPLPDGEILIKSGERGATLRTGGVTIEARTLRCAAVDTTGAGELLAGAFLSMRVSGVDDRRALRYAVMIASAKVTEFGLDGPNLRRMIERAHSETVARTPRDGGPVERV